jgi:hypothetical protein
MIISIDNPFRGAGASILVKSDRARNLVIGIRRPLAMVAWLWVHPTGDLTGWLAGIRWALRFERDQPPFFCSALYWLLPSVAENPQYELPRRCPVRALTGSPFLGLAGCFWAHVPGLPLPQLRSGGDRGTTLSRRCSSATPRLPEIPGVFVGIARASAISS